MAKVVTKAAIPEAELLQPAVAEEPVEAAELLLAEAEAVKPPQIPHLHSLKTLLQT